MVLKSYCDLFIPDHERLDISPLKLDELAQREIRILRQLNHPNLPKFVTAFELEPIEGLKVRNVAIEYIEKPSLRERIRDGTKLSETESRQLLLGILSGLEYLNTKCGEPIYHRDVKPSNILFDPRGASLVDFNFSHIGNSESEGTIMVDFGYYPLDAYSGRVDATQDLVALGNTVIAAMFGREISTIRFNQGIMDLDTPVDISSLPLSEKFAAYLRKLTTPKRGLRYQTAGAARGALEHLEQLSLETIESELQMNCRDPLLQAMLREIEQRDPLYAYNIPAQLLETASDSTLREHMTVVYSKPWFEIHDPEEVKRYADTGDRVRAKRMICTVLGELKKNDLGKVKKVGTDTARVKFGKTDWEIPQTDLEVRYRDWDRWAQYRFARADTFDRLSKGATVRYIGEHRELKKIFVEKNAEGILIGPISRNQYGYPQEKKYLVAWAGPGEGAGLKVWNTDSGLHITYERSFCPSEMILLKKNRINLAELESKCAEQIRRNPT